MDKKYFIATATIAAFIFLVAGEPGLAWGDEQPAAVTVLRGSLPTPRQPLQPQQAQATTAQPAWVSHCRSKWADADEAKRTWLCDTSAGPIYCRKEWIDADETKMAEICSPNY